VTQTSIYKITNATNGRVYFGKAVDPSGRWSSHKWAAAHGSKLLLHRAIRKYGVAAFHFEVLATHPDNGSACEHERKLIREAPKGLSYNLAKGGDGGPVMTQAQLDGQYAIGPSHYVEFHRRFTEGQTIVELKAVFGVADRAVRSCATRLGLSFKGRRTARKHERLHRIVVQNAARNRSGKVRQIHRLEPSQATLTPDAYSALRSEIAKRVNRARGISDATLSRIRALYHEGLCAREITARLILKPAVVRGVINRLYAALSPEERLSWKDAHKAAMAARRATS
jgi:predicted GIY-YIG superfamily endonuclease